MPDCSVSRDDVITVILQIEEVPVIKSSNYVDAGSALLSSEITEKFAPTLLKLLEKSDGSHRRFKPEVGNVLLMFNRIQVLYAHLFRFDSIVIASPPSMKS